MITLGVKKKLSGADGPLMLHVDLAIENGSFIALSGVSGSGKTTLLRMIAGLETADEGHIAVDDQIWHSDTVRLTPQKRPIGFVFQDYALFPHMSLLENLLYVDKNKALARELLEMMELWEIKDRNVTMLSGGQKQRVALARALMKRPKILLLDEPLSALDPLMRSKLQQELLKVHRHFKMTTILVSHDPAEIYKLCDRVVVLHHGTIVNDGSPRDILMPTAGSQKFTFEGEILRVEQVDVMHLAIVAIGSQLVEVVMDSYEARELKEGDVVKLSTKAFIPTISKIQQKKARL